VAGVLRELTIDDARHAYQAIRLAVPGGLGQVDEQDVAGEPTQDLRMVMCLAAERDALAREYATDYATTFEVTVPALWRYLREGYDGATATVGAYLELLAREPDSLIVRRHGQQWAAEVSRGAAAAVAAGGVRTAAGQAAMDAFDRRLREARPPLNPGTSADLVTAALFVALLEGAPLLQGTALGQRIAPAGNRQDGR
jgi:triphosphoribosyl-dephospho-CoA synthase